MSAACKGMDVLVWLEGDDEKPTRFEMHDKLSVPEMDSKFGKSTVYLVNTNLQSMPRASNGGIVWIENEGVLWLVRRSHGDWAHTIILHPTSTFKKGVGFLLTPAHHCYSHLSAANFHLS